jgi:hypothetical protein
MSQTEGRKITNLVHDMGKMQTLPPHYERERGSDECELFRLAMRERDFYDIMLDILPAGLYRKPQHINPQAWYPVQWSTPICKWRYI